MTGLVRDLILSAGKIIIFIGASISLLLGLGYAFMPDLLKAISKPVNRMFEAEEWLYLHKQAVGLAFLAVGVILFLVLALVR